MVPIRLISLLGTFFGYAIVLFAAIPAASLAELPIEVRDMIFSYLSIREYADLLVLSSDARLLRGSAFFEYDLLRRSAVHLGRTIRQYGAGAGELEDILDGVRMLIGLCSGLPSDEEKRDDVTLRGMAHRLEETFQMYAALSTSPLWRQTCFASLVGNNKLRRLHPYLSKTYRQRHRDLMKNYAAAIGDYKLLTYLIDDSQTGWNSVMPTIVAEIARQRSMVLFKKIVSHVSLNKLVEHGFGRHLVRHNSMALFQILLDGLNVVDNPSHGPAIREILDAACEYGQSEMINALFTSFPNHFTSLHIMDRVKRAVDAGDFSLFKALLWDGAGEGGRRDVRLGDAFIWSMLRRALQKHRLEMFEFLLFTYAPRLASTSRRKCLELFARAAGDGNFPVMRLLLNAGPDGMLLIEDLEFNAPEGLILTAVARAGRSDVLDYFMQKKEAGDARFGEFNPSVNAHLVLRKAACSGRAELVRCLLRHREAIPASSKNRALIGAAHGGHVDVVKELLLRDDRGDLFHSDVNPAVNDNEPLILAFTRGHLAVARLLLRVKGEEGRGGRGEGEGGGGGRGTLVYALPGIDVTARGHAALTAAVGRRDLEMIRFLLRSDERGRFILPGMQIPEHLLPALEELGFPPVHIV